ncbi:MAG: SPFH domain-containing protein [Bacteroidales bacterium]
MKKNYLIAILLLISIQSQSNNLTIRNNGTKIFSNSSIILLNDIITPNNGNLIREPNYIEINVPHQKVTYDSLRSISKGGVDFSYNFKIWYTPENNYVASLQTPNDTHDFAHSDIMNGIFGQYSIGEIYSFKRDEIESLILEKLKRKFKENHINVVGILYLNIQFSEKIKKEIEEKLFREHQKNKSNNNHG